jgi:hypothetical protein
MRLFTQESADYFLSIVRQQRDEEWKTGYKTPNQCCMVYYFQSNSDKSFLDLVPGDTPLEKAELASQAMTTMVYLNDLSSSRQEAYKRIENWVKINTKKEHTQ